MKTKECNCLNQAEKKFILANHEKGKSYSEIDGLVRRSESVVYRVISRFKADKTLGPKPRTSRPAMTTKLQDDFSNVFKRLSIQQSLFLVHFVSKQESQSLQKLFLVG